MDIDDELVTLIRARKQVVLILNMLDRGVAADWRLKGSVGEAELAKIQAASTIGRRFRRRGPSRPGISKASDAGVTIAMGTDGNTACRTSRWPTWWPRHDPDAGHRGRHEMAPSSCG